MAPHINNAVLPKSEEERTKFLSFLKKQIKEHPVVKEHHGKWKELIEWTDEGNQYAEWSGDVRAVQPVPLRRRKKKLVINLMKPVAEAFESKINTNSKVAGSPGSSELEDIEASKVATKLLAYNDYINAIESLWEDFKYDLTRTGTAFLKEEFDKEENGYTKGGEGKIKKADGEVIMSVPSVFNLRPDPSGKDRKNWHWFIELVEMTHDDIISKYGIEEEKLEAAEEVTAGAKYEGMNEPEAEKDKETKTHIITIYWEKSSKKYPKGRLIHSTGNTCLFADENPGSFPEYKQEIPFFKTIYHRKGNSAWGKSPMFYIQPIQRDFNRFVSIISEHIEGWRPKIIVDAGSIKKGAFVEEPFEILERMPGTSNPVPVNMPNLGSEVFAHRDFLRSMIPEVSNVHEVSYARLPQYASRAPASLYSMMLEQEDIKLDPLIVRWNAMILDAAKYRLMLMDKFYTQERMVKIIGKNEETSIQWFKGSDIRRNFDVRLEIGISIHQSKTIMQRMILELKKNNVLTDKDNSKILKMLMLGDIGEDLRGDIADETRAMRENQAFISGTSGKDFEKGGVMIWIHDNHEVHLGRHTDLWKTEEVQRWEKEKRLLLEGHVQQHLVYYQALTQAAAAKTTTTGTTVQAKAAPTSAAGEMLGGGGPTAVPTPEVTEQRALTA